MDDDRRLDAAVSLGIITAAQAADIRALTPERAVRPSPSTSGGAASLGYALGAITVLIAMGWFLADRWDWLGPGGVLAVVAVYATVFLAVARRLRNEGSPNASGALVLLAVLLTPIAVTALNHLTGWNIPGNRTCYSPEFVFWSCRGEEVVMELATATMALIALRRVRFTPLVAVLAAIALRALFHVTDALGRGGFGNASAGWVWAMGASLLTAAAYHVSRVQDSETDFALWLHVAAVISALAASVLLVGEHPSFRHLLVPSALVSFFFALRVRRLLWQLLGLGWFAGYLVWLSSDVFRDTPFFPIVLAALGVGMIILTVWLQRNSDRLVARFGGMTVGGRPAFPGGVTLILAPAAVALLNLPGAVALDREHRRGADARAAQAAAEERRAAGAARDSAGVIVRPETLVVPKP